MGKAHDDSLRPRALGSTGPRTGSPAPRAPASGELLSEVFGLEEPESGAPAHDPLEAVGARALASRFSLRRGRTRGVGAAPAARVPRAQNAPGDELGPLLAEPGAIRWEGAIFERVSSIEQQLQEVEERLGKRIPEVEERLLHLLETRLLRFERELDSSLAGLSEHISRVGEGSRFRLGLILAGTLVLVLLSLLVVFRLI